MDEHEPTWREKFFEADALARKRRKQLERIRALHFEGKVPENGFNQGWDMTWCERDHEAWPCATIRIVEEDT